MKFKKAISIILCLVTAFSVLAPASAASGYPKTVSEPVRIIDGIFELVYNLACMANFKRNYENCIPVCEMPEIEKGFVPQGFCFIDSENLFAVTYYGTNDENSIVAFIDAASGERIKTVKLVYEDGTPCRSHAGGIADIGDSLFISSGKSVRRLRIADALAAPDYSEAAFCGTLATHMQASYLCSYENILFVGQYYSFTLDGAYDTPADQRIYTPSGKRHYAMCEAYDLSDTDAVLEAGEAVPIAAFSMPNRVQGIAYDGKAFTLSISSGIFAASPLEKYELKSFESDYVINLGGNDVPLIFICKDRLLSKTMQPPMMEGIDCRNGGIAGIFESCADKFSAALVRTPYICELG